MKNTALQLIGITSKGEETALATSIGSAANYPSAIIRDLTRPEYKPFVRLILVEIFSLKPLQRRFLLDIAIPDTNKGEK